MKFYTPILYSALLLNNLPAALSYVESGGQVVGEAEIYSYRELSGVNGWFVVPGEEAGAGTMTNYRGSGYIQMLPDGLDGAGGANNAPSISYEMNITTAGTYRLFVRGEATDGAADSYYASIVELRDGTGATGNVHADWYEFNNVYDQDFATNPWDGLAGAEENQASSSNDPALWVISTPGTYTLEFSEREDGAAIDSWVFQLDSLSAPTGDGPAISQTIPEPTSLLLLASSAFSLMIRRR